MYKFISVNSEVEHYVWIMSWFNLNDSFNNIKGQISNFATEVLTDSADDTGNFAFK